MLPRSALHQAQPGDLIVGYPACYKLATRDGLTLPVDVIALTSTEPCLPLLWRRLQAAGCAGVIEAYGSSETAGIGVRMAPDAPFELLPHWSRHPDETDWIQRLDTSGAPVRFALQDHLYWLDSGCFHVAGRRDRAVQIAGINVFPQRIEAMLRNHPEIAEAAVRLARVDQGGRLKAFVVPSPECADPATLVERLHLWLGERLPALERPRTITIGRQLPRSELGKVIDWG